MGQINRIPVGYLDLVGTETGGRNPNQATENVNPTVSMNELYSSQTLAGKNFATNSSAVGNNNFITVPDSETWIMYGAAANVLSPLAGDQDIVSLFADRLPRAASPAGNNATIATFDLLSIGVAQNPSASQLFPVPFVLPHGARIIAQIMQRAGGAALRVVNINCLVGVLVG